VRTGSRVCAAMRSLIYTLWSLATITRTLAAEAAPTRSTDDWEDAVPDTIFNGQTVPPIKELDMRIEEDMSKGNW
jgi:protein disulfide-isomerase